MKLCRKEWVSCLFRQAIFCAIDNLIRGFSVIKRGVYSLMAVAYGVQEIVRYIVTTY